MQNLNNPAEPYQLSPFCFRRIIAISFGVEVRIPE
jgi:hypothetical protein